LIERSIQGLSIAIKTMRIIEELMEIWPNEVCDNKRRQRQCLSNTVQSRNGMTWSGVELL